MYRKQLFEDQIGISGVRMGDEFSIFPLSGRKKVITLNRTMIDLVSPSYRPTNLSMSYVELAQTHTESFHYRLELDKGLNNGRFFLKTFKGQPFWINGLAAKEAYIERLDKLFIEDNKLHFIQNDEKDEGHLHIDHPVLALEQLLKSELNILIHGETGTGKTHLAAKIHQKSGRMGPFVSINLSSYNPHLIESELFGHKKGSFTGAISDKVGALVLASHGTLFLDEIDSLPMDLQTKLLTFLDSKKFRQVGDHKELEIKTRMIFASGRPMEQLVLQGTFRKDFYYRLKAGHTIELTSLRNDVKRIREACHFYAKENQMNLSKRLIDFYETLAWPGNLRQLFGHLNKKKVFSRSVKLDFDTLDEDLLSQSSDLMNIQSAYEIIPMEEYKLKHIKKALGACEGNVALAARKLRLSEKTVRTLMTKC